MNSGFVGGDTMLIALSEYAKMHGRSSDTLRRLAENGLLKTAKKLGETGLLIAKKIIRSKSARNLNPLPLYHFFLDAVDWI